MRIAISADDSRGLDSVVSPHFGRCPYYVLVDLDGREVRQVSAVENPYHGHHQPGQVPSFINSQGVNVMLAGGMGRRAIAWVGICRGPSRAAKASSTLTRKLSPRAPIRDRKQKSSTKRTKPGGCGRKCRCCSSSWPR